MHQWTNFDNWLIFDKDMDKTLWLTFLDHPVCVWEVLISHVVLSVQFKLCVSSIRITYWKRKLVVFLVFTCIYFLCPTSKSLWNLPVKLTFCRKPKDAQDALKSLLETGESIFFLGEIPKHLTRDPFGIRLNMAGPLLKSRRRPWGLKMWLGCGSRDRENDELTLLVLLLLLL